MKTRIILTLALLPFTASATGFIINPDGAVAKSEAEILKRVVRLESADGLCSGTWLEDGIVITADHCGTLASNGVVAVNGQWVALEGEVRFSASYPAGTKFHEQELFEAEPAQNPVDFRLWLINKSGRTSLNSLPQGQLPIASPKKGPVKPGTRLLIAGYGVTDLNGNLPNQVQASLVKTAKVPSYSLYSMAISKQTVARFVADCPAGKSIMDCPIGVELITNQDKSGMIISGDSGGPAFVKGDEGWELIGVASQVAFKTDDERTVDFKYQYGSDKLRTQPLRLKRKAGGGLLEHVVGRMLFGARQILGIDLAQSKGVLPQRFQSEQEYGGTIEGFHVNLSDPAIQQGLIQSLEALRRQRDGKPQSQN